MNAPFPRSLPSVRRTSLGVTVAPYSCLRGMYMRHGTKHVRAPKKRRTSKNAVNAKFAERGKGEVRRILLPRCEYPGGWLWATLRSGLTLLPRIGTQPELPPFTLSPLQAFAFIYGTPTV